MRPGEGNKKGEMSRRSHIQNMDTYADLKRKVALSQLRQVSNSAKKTRF